MDFGALVSVNNPDKIEWENYPLKECTFYTTFARIEREHSPIKNHKKMTQKKDLSIIVHLHKDHKIYYTSNLDEYEPFTLPKSI